MFSSLASFLFGLNTNCETNSERTATSTATGLNEESDKSTNLADADNLTEITSLTPSIAGAGEKAQSAIKRGKNKRNNARKQNKRNEVKTPLGLNLKQAKVLSPSNSCDEEEFDDWCIIEKEEVKPEDFPVHNDSEEENAPINELAESTKLLKSVAGNNSAQQRRQQHISLHSSYCGPRPQKQRNSLQKTRNNTNNNRPCKGLSVSTLSPSRTVTDGCLGSKYEDPADGQANDFETVNVMEESWFITPPPCFTSTGPINMETSPYENLLIEHPSMSVYHSIKMAQDTTENFVKLDIGLNDLFEREEVEEPTPRKKSQAPQPSSADLVCRLNRQSVSQLKQEFLARNVQKVQIKREMQDKCRSAIKRNNKVRDVQSRNHVQRRSDRQYSKICSNASNNRKTNCY